MSLKQDFSGQYTSKQEEILISEGSRAAAMILMLKGKIDVMLSPSDSLSDRCRLFTLDGNTFLGVNDILRDGKSSLSLKADENCTVFCFPASSLADIKSTLSTQKDYSTYLVSSLATLVDRCYTAYQKLLPVCQSMDVLTRNLLIYYWAIKDKYNFSLSSDGVLLRTSMETYEGLKKENYPFFPVDTDTFSSRSVYDESEEDSELDTTSIEYFSSLLNVPMEQRKGFFNSDGYICEYHIRKSSETLDGLISEIKSILSKLYKDMDTLCHPLNGLIAIYGNMAVDLKEDKEAALTIINILTKAVETASQNLNTLHNDFDFLKALSSQELSVLLNNVIEKTALRPSHSEIEDSTFDLPEELQNSLEKILMFCSCSQEKIDNFNRMVSKFRAIKDKTSLNPEERALRETLTTEFFAIYEEVFKRSLTNPNYPKLISMFLNFGYMDERLVTRDQAITLYRLCDKEYPCGNFSVYNTKQWLEQIYQNKKEPSINEFGQDYSDIFREMKKQRLLSDSDKAKYDNDVAAKLNFEITNMLKTNQKVCHGHISSYFPILHNDIITRDLEKAAVTPARLEKAFSDLLAIDFSVFYREIWYKNDLKGIEKELIMKEIRPDIIIVPTFGSRVSMWQEIAGRNRSAPGRFLVPAFTDESLEKLVLRLFGAFRWELCRTMAGVAWSDITEKSLTSEYTDYIQFYKNNSDLSEDAKEKIKHQIQRNRSMMREIFEGDYESWINYEVKGSQRLNKIARSIMMRYCPPAKEIRSALARHPAFSDLVTQVNYLREKTAKSLTSRYAKLFKGGPMDRDMELNLIFYRDL